MGARGARGNHPSGPKGDAEWRAAWRPGSDGKGDRLGRRARQGERRILAVRGNAALDADPSGAADDEGGFLELERDLAEELGHRDVTVPA